MGSSHDVMQTFALKEIRAHFTEYEGWVYREITSPSAHDMAGILSRDVRGRTEMAALAVSYNEEPSALALETLAISLKRKALKGQYLIVPKAANVSAIPKTVQVIFMESFGFVDGKLIWLTKKKNAKHYSSREVLCTPETASAACQPHAA